jgi:hypothetical protein
MVKIPKGILAGLELAELAEKDFRNLTESPAINKLPRSSFYGGYLKKITFRGITFSECNLARATFERAIFSRCKFVRVDLTRTAFKDCIFSDTTFVDCDPYYASFSKTEVAPSSFRNCFRTHDECNKALILFSQLRLSLREMGESRSSRAAEYYFRVWQRRRLFQRWHFKRISGFGSWFSSLCLGAFTGYGERPIYLAGWAFAVVTALSEVYMRWLPYALEGANHHFRDYWYYSFKVFFAQGLSASFQSVSLSLAQVGEFLSGILMVSLLIGSIARKLSP